jgi:hypothetical protein
VKSFSDWFFNHSSAVNGDAYLMKFIIRLIGVLNGGNCSKRFLWREMGDPME